MARSKWWISIAAAFAALAWGDWAAEGRAHADPLAPSAVGIPPPGLIAPPDAQSVLDKLAFGDDGGSRMTIPVMIDGHGPYRFIIDTAADRTVISRELAATLNLPSGAHVILHESAGQDDIETAVVTRLGVGARIVPRIEAPVLSAENLGAAGLLGIDSLHDQHVVMDFETRQMTSTPSRGEAFDPYTIVIRGKSRFGQLILVDSQVKGVPVYVILDSGAQDTVGNPALKRLLQKGDGGRDPPTLVNIISVTGRKIPAQSVTINEMHVGPLTIRHVALAFASLHTFDRFGLSDRPALLLGMDVLSQCRRVTVDFKRREASFTLNTGDLSGLP